MKLALLLQKCLPILFWALLMFGFDAPFMAILTIVSALIHELGHLCVLKLLNKGDFHSVYGRIFGFGIPIRNLSYKEELLVALGGPFINILFGVLFTILPQANAFLSYLRLFGILNIMTALSNILPIESYDGYRILHSLIAIFSKDYERGESVLFSLSFLFSAILCLLSLYLILKIGEGYWIFAVFFSILLTSIAKVQKRTF